MRRNEKEFAFLTPSPISSICAQKRWRRPYSIHRCSATVGKNHAASSTEVILSIDLGTSLCKAALFNYHTGKLCGTISSEGYPLHSDKKFHATQAKAKWDSALFSVASSALEHRPDNACVKAIAMTGQMQDLLGSGPATPRLLREDVILYSDARAVAEAERVSGLIGMPIEPTSLLAKLALLPDPPCVDNANMYSIMLGGADYALSRLANEPGGLFLTDPTTLSTTGLSRAPHRAYDENLLTKAGLSRFLPLLPTIQPTLSVSGALSASAAESLGAPELRGTPLVHAGGDAATATFGAGRFAAADGAYLYAGTSGWLGCVRAAEPLPVAAAHSGLFRLAHPHTPLQELLLASMASAAGNFTFAADVFLGGISPSALSALALTSPVGARGVAYAPYIRGRRCPRPHARASGAFVGLTGASSRADVARAVIEGVAFGFRACASELARAGGVGDEELLTVVGGGAQSDALMSALAGALRRPVQRGATGEVGLRGAAFGAAVALGDGAEMGWTDRGREAAEVWWPIRKEEEEWEAAWRTWVLNVEAMERTW